MEPSLLKSIIRGNIDEEVNNKLITDNIDEEVNNELICNICIDMVTDVDNWLTTDTTEDQIVAYVEQICLAIAAVIPDPMTEFYCKALIENQLPGIIEALVNQGLNPTQFCNQVGACP